MFPPVNPTTSSALVAKPINVMNTTPKTQTFSQIALLATPLELKKENKFFYPFPIFYSDLYNVLLENKMVALKLPSQVLNPLPK